MNSKYPILSPHEIIKVLHQFGFEKVSQKGSHAKYKNCMTGRVCIIPIHNEVARGTLKSILDQANITIEEFLNQL